MKSGRGWPDGACAPRQVALPLEDAVGMQASRKLSKKVRDEVYRLQVRLERQKILGLHCPERPR